MDRETKGQFFSINFNPDVDGVIQLLENVLQVFQLCFDHLFSAVWGQVEYEDCEEGDAHAGDDQVHLVVVVMITKGKVIMITKEDMVDDAHHQEEGEYNH